jgi:hypothetical protein
MDGLYLMRVVAIEDGTYGSTGVVVLQDGKIRGGGANLYYIGSYSANGGRVKGELIVNTHTPYPGDQLFFGASEIGVGFSGTYERDEASWFATALHRKRSISLRC